VHTAGEDATAYYTKAALKGKKKPRKKCSYYKNKGHTASKCCKHKQEEKLSRSNLALNTSPSKTLGKSSSGKSLSRGSSSRTSFSRTTDSMKIVAANSDSDTSADSDDTI
jgi:hypothetical protein